MSVKESFLEKSKVWVFVILAVIILIYFFSRIFNFLYGPIIKIYSPSKGEIVKTETFYVDGNVKNVKNISINGKDITIDEKGNFKEEIIAKSPYTLVVIEAIDKYSKTKEQILEVGKE